MHAAPDHDPDRDAPAGAAAPRRPLISSYFWPVFKDTGLRAQYDAFLTVHKTVNKGFLVFFWLFVVVDTVFVSDLVSASALSGEKGRIWQSAILVSIGSLLLMFILTALIIFGDENLANHTFYWFPGFRTSDACALREGISGAYVIMCFIAQGYALFARTVSDKCLESAVAREIMFCDASAYPLSSPIPADNFLVLVLFLVICQLSFPQLKWTQYAACWTVGLFFLLMVVAHAVIIRGVNGLSHEAVLHTVLYFAAYAGLYLFMGWLHRSKLWAYLESIGTERVIAINASSAVDEASDHASLGPNRVATVYSFPAQESIS
jgi:hypothetical protein